MGRYVIKGETDLQTINPTLANEWNYKRNNGLTPYDVTPHSGKNIWWKCKNGHEWQASVNHRSNGTGCPYCSSKMISVGYNDLQTVKPTLANEWNYKRNNGLTPLDVTPHSGKKVWWRCSKGHEWQASIGSRNQGRGCPYCTSQKVWVGYNDLQTINPTLAKEWNYEKNIAMSPSDVMPNSNKKVWWKCLKWHEWQASIANRNKGHGCPYCSGRKKWDDNYH